MMPAVADLPSNHFVRSVLPAERLLYASDLVSIGDFRCRPGEPGFTGGTPCTSWCFVFPRRSVWIQHEGGEWFVADPSVVTFYNRDAVYRRSAISADGDLADWFALAPDVLVDAVAARDAAVLDRPLRPFRFDRGPVRAHCYLAQRLLHEAVQRGDADPLEVDEGVIALVEMVMDEAYDYRGLTGVQRYDRAGGVVEDAKAVLATRVSQRLSLSDIARQLDVSPYYLCHGFRRLTSSTLSAYLLQVRLRLSLERIAAGQTLTDVALEFGFSSHSHFTARFRRAFGLSPSRVRNLGRCRLRDLQTSGAIPAGSR